VVPVLDLEEEALDLVPALGPAARARVVAQGLVVAAPDLVAMVAAAVLEEALVCRTPYIARMPETI
jgi:hypothetical protein